MSISVQPEKAWYRRVPAVGWIAALLALAVAIIAATGGFAQGSGAYRGPEYQPTEMIPTKYWDVGIGEAQISGETQKLEVRVIATNKNDAGLATLTSTLLLVALVDEDGKTIEILSEKYCLSDDGRRYNPNVEVGAICNFEMPDQSDFPLSDSGEARFLVVVFDHEMDDSNLIMQPELRPRGAAGHVFITAGVVQ